MVRVGDIKFLWKFFELLLNNWIISYNVMDNLKVISNYWSEFFVVKYGIEKYFFF